MQYNKKNLDSWSHFVKFQANNKQERDEFGFSLSCKNGTLLVGSPSWNNEGKVEVYQISKVASKLKQSFEENKPESVMYEIWSESFLCPLRDDVKGFNFNFNINRH